MLGEKEMVQIADFWKDTAAGQGVSIEGDWKQIVFCEVDCILGGWKKPWLIGKTEK